MREVPGSTPGQALCDYILSCFNNNQPCVIEFCVVSTGIFYYVDLKNRANFAFFSTCVLFSLFSLPVIEEMLQEQISERRKMPSQCLADSSIFKGATLMICCLLTFLEILQPRSHLSVAGFEFLKKNWV